MPESSLANDDGTARRASQGQQNTGANENDTAANQIILVHVLFIDLIGYSLLKVDMGSLIVQEVFQIVSDTAQCRRAKAAGELILLPSGDGTAVVFLRDPAAPAQCAEEISRAVSKRPDIKLRMGVNSGPASWIFDINGNRIVAGAGINYAQRAMDCGDAGHILLTNSTAEYLLRVTEWAKKIHDLGTYEVKHDEVVHLYNLYSSDAGNPKPISRRRIIGPEKRGIFHKIVEMTWSLPLTAMLALAVAAAGGLIYLLSAEEPQLFVTNLTPGDAIGINYPQFSPDGHKLAYVMKSRSGKWDVYVQKFDQGQLVDSPRNLTEHFGGDSTAPAFTYGGEQVAFSSQSGPAFSHDGRLMNATSDLQSEGIFVENESSGQPERVADRGYNPVWSHDGMTILFASENISRPEDRKTILSKLSIVTRVGSRVMPLYDGDAVQPAWSPNDRRIVFWFMKNGIRDIATIPAEGGPAVPLTNDPYVDWNPVWGPDGYVYFSSDRGRDGLKLWRIRVDENSGNPKGRPVPVELVVQGGPGEKPVEVGNIAVSQDGSKFAFVDRIYSAQLCKVRFDPQTGKSDQEVLSVAVPDRPSTRPDLDSTGRWLIYNKQNGISIIEANGLSASQLVADDFINRSPRWSSNGSVAFFSNRSGSYQIWIGERRANSLKLRELIKTAVTSLYPVWSPPGDQLAFTTWESNRDPELQTVVTNLDPVDVKPAPQVAKPESQFDGGFIVWSWSPKGHQLAGYRQRSDGKFTGIFIYNLETRQYKQVSSFGSDPVWLNDDHRLLFQHKGNIYIVDSALPDPQKDLHLVLSVSPQSVAPRGFAISADNRWIYFSREDEKNRLWVGTLQNSSVFSQILDRVQSQRH